MTRASIPRVSAPTDAAAVRDAFINTYQPPGEADAATLVRQYETVRAHMAEHPTQQSAAVATALDLSRGRIRSWVDDDGRPDAMRGLETLTEHGWLHHEWTDRSLAALTGLCAWVVAGGTIVTTDWQAAFSVADGTAGDLTRLGEALGLDWRQRHTDDERSGTEWLPRRHGSVLARLLAVLGAPVEQAGPPALPPWLVAEDCPRALRLDAARIIVRQRGTVRADRPATPIQLKIGDGRSDAIRRLLQTVAPPQGEIRADEGGHLRLTPRAVELLGTVPAIGEAKPRAHGLVQPP